RHGDGPIGNGGVDDGRSGQHRASGRRTLGVVVRARAPPRRCRRAAARPPGGPMSALASDLIRPGRPGHDDVPLDLMTKPVGGDRVFNGILAGSSAIVLALMVAVVVFLFAYGFHALRAAHWGIGLFDDPAWSPDSGHFGMMALLVGSIAIALVSVAIAAPVSIAMALMINEYAPRQLKPFLTAVVDLLATVPSI